MLLVTFSTDGPPRLGVQRESDIVDVAALSPDAPTSLWDVVRGDAADAVTALLSGPIPESALHPIDAVRLHAPLRPGKIVGVGLNYTEHVTESARALDTAQELPQKPVLFCKPSTAVIGPGEAIEHNAALTSQLDWECELAVVIGRTAKRVTPERALDHVFGYSIVNDISARDQRRAGLWFYSKGQDTFAPFGPAIRTADEIPDPHALDLSLRVNGEVRQKSSTRYMLFRIPELIADISAGITLEPGDVIATGTPSGVGAGMSPQQWLWPGDVVEATVQHIGTLRNPVVDVR
ncbi:2-keto-4-pentenoate hydratase/2-oxohepta-3-ene-1,7-dioic acid hydratase in catechol pathway [Saccharothrix tamanrassetensis]|uniref:2-keto-4-pentenoate hydratase/2-oxohepta-3-ene-1,7-dioic acid hydratase in catechol pathway n=1 Tax=Saccharothrix tamanrassetensis TaxID=1051531 RepID=A0A841CCM3_9PSEU|nr:fumarylacetoacetate hydrolase family protein [Saccharothrix tamanrassetensis]MBB5953927.1 2-keto-4-pentenoate hydratase/2-oxohepta-3-ene-1,7-dioic acid hydratase in catechol pathway [Saccharothrix tamanrassetensis]